MRSPRAALRWALRAAVTVGIALYIVKRVDVAAIGVALRDVRVAPIAGAAVIYLVSQALSAWKWALLGRSVGLERPLADYVRFYFIGMFFNLFAPSTIGGDVVRGLYLGGGRRPGLALNSVVFDRLSGLAMLLALAAGALVASGGAGLPHPLIATVVAAGLAVLGGWWSCPRLARLLPEANRVRRMVEGDLAPFWRDRALLARVAALSLFFHLTQVVGQYMVAHAAGAPVSFAYCCVYHPIISVLAALPLSIAGIGVREGGYIWFFARAGLGDALAVTVSLLWFAIGVLGALLGGVVFLASGATLPSLRREPATS